MGHLVTEERAAFLDAVIAAARPTILENFTADSCIVSTKIGLDVLAYFGIPAQEYPVTISVFNAEAAAILTETGDLMKVKAATEAYEVADEGGPWTLAVGAPGFSEVRPDGSRGWPGHLVIGIRSWGVILDLSLDQAARPHKNLHLEPAWFPVPETWWDIETEAEPTVFDGADGSILVLHHRHDTAYKGTGNWKRVARGDKRIVPATTGRIIRALKDAGITAPR